MARGGTWQSPPAVPHWIWHKGLPEASGRPEADAWAQPGEDTVFGEVMVPALLGKLLHPSGGIAVLED
jgi:hypothetical protein